ncbi:MAG: ORF6N domain-containing protein [Elusimicrobia bacterium]|nr:ORF6N domain-containing protein [Elusimicrobiota bacterium]
MPPQNPPLRAVPTSELDKLIHSIRGQRVMIDAQLAHLYGVPVRQLKRQVRRNLERFPQDFMFQLTRAEYASLRCQIGTFKRGAHAKYLPYAFTEQGVAMLSSVLRSRRAVLVNLAIMRAFVRLRQALSTHEGLRDRLDAIEDQLAGQRGELGRHARRIKEVFDAIRRLMTPPEEPPRRIGFLP